MDQTQIGRIKAVKQELNALVVELTPSGVSEWEGFDHLYAASRDMRRINPDKLGQLPLTELPAPAEKPTDQLTFPQLVAVQGGEDSLNTPAPPALAEPPEDEFNTIRSPSRFQSPEQQPPIKRGRHHARA